MAIHAYTWICHYIYLLQQVYTSNRAIPARVILISKSQWCTSWMKYTFSTKTSCYVTLYLHKILQLNSVFLQHIKFTHAFSYLLAILVKYALRMRNTRRKSSIQLVYSAHTLHDANHFLRNHLKFQAKRDAYHFVPLADGIYSQQLVAWHNNFQWIELLVQLTHSILKSIKMQLWRAIYEFSTCDALNTWILRQRHFSSENIYILKAIPILNQNINLYRNHSSPRYFVEQSKCLINIDWLLF